MRHTQLQGTAPPSRHAGPRPAVQLRDLRKSFGDHAVLRGIDLTIDTGEVFALLGPNGAGKTTLVHILATLTAPDSGTARIGGFDVTVDADQVRGIISLTGQYAAVDDLLTARENLVMMGRLNDLDRPVARARATELLTRFDLTGAADRRVGTYSGGMRRRLDIAASLVGRPSVLFLDEPTTGLDPRSRADVWGFVRELAADGVTILLTTQYLEEADQLADRIALLDGGRLVTTGTAAELKHHVGSAWLQVTFGDGHSEAFPTDGSVGALHDALGGLRLDPRGVQSVELHTPSLDDVFLTLTEHRRAPDDLGSAADSIGSEQKAGTPQ